MQLFSRSKIQPDVFRLTAAQALGGANAVIAYATGAIVGEMFAPSKSLATPSFLFLRAESWRRSGEHPRAVTGTAV